MRNFADAIFVPSKAKNFSIAIATVKFFNAARCKKSEAKIADLGWLNYSSTVVGASLGGNARSVFVVLQFAFYSKALI